MGTFPGEGEHIMTESQEQLQDSEETTNEDVIQEIDAIPDSNIGASSLLRSFTRLAVGGVLVGWDELIARVGEWEDETRSAIDSQVESREVIIIGDEAETSGYSTVPAPESSARMVRLALVGMFFEAQSRLVSRTTTAIKNANRRSNRAATPVSRWARDSKLVKRAERRFDSLISRGETVTQRWIEQGRVEDAYSRRLVRTAAQDSFSDSMEQLGQAPQLQSLIRKQSAGLTQDALDEVRVRTVSGDLVLEGFFRSLLRRRSRRTLPPPPDARRTTGPEDDA
jgi:hypothetical protein